MTLISFHSCYSIDSETDMENGPASKKRKTASVIVDQPAESDKMVVDQVTDVSATFEEVWYLCTGLSRIVFSNPFTAQISQKTFLPWLILTCPSELQNPHARKEFSH